METTLTLFIALDGLSESSRKARKFKRFFIPKTGGLQKKKRSSPKLRLIFRPNSEIQAFFQTKNRWSPKKKKKKRKRVLTDIETDFPANIRNSNAFSDRITTCSSQLRLPIFFGGGCFQFFTKNRPQKHKNVRFCTLHKPMGGSSPPAPPWLRYWALPLKKLTSINPNCLYCITLDKGNLGAGANETKFERGDW